MNATDISPNLSTAGSQTAEEEGKQKTVRLGREAPSSSSVPPVPSTDIVSNTMSAAKEKLRIEINFCQEMKLESGGQRQQIGNWYKLSFINVKILLKAEPCSIL